MWDEITLQCRGLVTDNEGNVVARPFKKFFNIEEGKHTPTEEFEVFEKMEIEYPSIKYKPDHVGQANFDGARYIHAFFDTVIDTKDSITGGGSERYLSEDYMFCQMWRKMGGTIFLCPWMKTQHIGTYAFSGNMPAVAQYTGKL